MRVFVLLFNVGTENEGIHSLKIENRDVVLMFEDEDDATRFALMLEAQDFPEATVEALEEDEIQEFCASVGYEAKLLPSGTLALPPEANVEATDWQEDGRHRQPTNQAEEPMTELHSGPDVSPSEKPGEDAEPEAEGQLSEAELERLRRQLESLL